ncbi:MAG: hypothetical protein LBQ15_00235 [Clostridium sp.]|jgi:hypothetical protein|nr:hypothetical protein [Clostridium sp.]
MTGTGAASSGSAATVYDNSAGVYTWGSVAVSGSGVLAGTAGDTTGTGYSNGVFSWGSVSVWSGSLKGEGGTGKMGGTGVYASGAIAVTGGELSGTATGTAATASVTGVYSQTGNITVSGAGSSLAGTVAGTTKNNAGVRVEEGTLTVESGGKLTGDASKSSIAAGGSNEYSTIGVYSYHGILVSGAGSSLAGTGGSAASGGYASVGVYMYGLTSPWNIIVEKGGVLTGIGGKGGRYSCGVEAAKSSFYVSGGGVLTGIGDSAEIGGGLYSTSGGNLGDGTMVGIVKEKSTNYSRALFLHNTFNVSAGGRIIAQFPAVSALGKENNHILHGQLKVAAPTSGEPLYLYRYGYATSLDSIEDVVWTPDDGSAFEPPSQYAYINRPAANFLYFEFQGHLPTVTYHGGGEPGEEGEPPARQPWTEAAEEAGFTIAGTAASGDAKASPGGTLAKPGPGVRFLGWNTERDGSGDFYAPGEIYGAGATAGRVDSLDLYAQWGASPGSWAWGGARVLPEGLDYDAGEPEPEDEDWEFSEESVRLLLDAGVIEDFEEEEIEQGYYGKIWVEVDLAGETPETEMIRSKAQEEGREVPRYVDLTLRKAVYDEDGGIVEAPVAVPETPLPLTLTTGLPEGLEGRTEGLALWRVHQGELQSVPRWPETNADGEYFTVEGSLAVMYLRKFSVYAFAPLKADPGQEGDGGSGAGGSPCPCGRPGRRGGPAQPQDRRGGCGARPAGHRAAALCCPCRPAPLTGSLAAAPGPASGGFP